MVALGETPPSAPSRDKVLCRHWRQLYVGSLQEGIEFVSGSAPPRPSTTMEASSAFATDIREEEVVAIACSNSAASGSR